jgi:predicted aspartyl protease
MRPGFIGAVAVERLVALVQLHIRALAIASLLALLTSAEAGASNKIDGDSIFIAREKSVGPLTAGRSSGPYADSSATAVSTAANNTYSETYWSAVADLDIDALTKAARNAPEAGFARGMSFLANGDRARAESAFVALGSGVTDFNVGIASQMMLAHTLLYERKWAMLRDLPANPELRSEDTKNIEELERWGRAFANLEPQTTRFPIKPVSLPLRTTSLGTPAIRVKINGKEYEFWLDTGSSITVLSSEVAAAAGVPTISSDTLTIRTFGGTARVRPALVRRMDVGSIVLTNTPVIVIDASLMLLKSPAAPFSTASHYVDGIVGWDFIRQFDVLLDYDKGVIQLARPEREVASSGTQNLLWVGQPLVAVRTRNGRTLHLALDTGAQSTLLNASVLDKTSAVTTSLTTRVFGLARTGSSSHRVIPELPLQVAGRSLRLHNVIVYGPTYSGLIACDGILGNDIARFGRIHIDATNGIFSVGA